MGGNEVVKQANGCLSSILRGFMSDAKESRGPLIHAR